MLSLEWPGWLRRSTNLVSVIHKYFISHVIFWSKMMIFQNLLTMCVCPFMERLLMLHWCMCGVPCIFVITDISPHTVFCSIGIFFNTDSSESNKDTESHKPLPLHYWPCFTFSVLFRHWREPCLHPVKPYFYQFTFELLPWSSSHWQKELLQPLSHFHWFR